jgi:hypothetical protein
MDRLSDAVQEAQMLAHRFGMVANGKDGDVGATPDPALQKIIEVASEYLDDPQVQGAFDPSMSIHVQR